MIALTRQAAGPTTKFEVEADACMVYRVPETIYIDFGGRPKVRESVKPENWEDLLGAVALRSDRKAYETLFLHFAPRVKAYLMRLGSDPVQAEDLMQDVMAQVWRKSKLFDRKKAGASTWIFTIARNLRIDGFRRDRRPEIDENDPALVPEPDQGADEVLHWREISLRLREILAQLPDEQRAVVELSFYEDMAHGAIAEELGVPLGTVKSRLRLAMGKIKGVWGTVAGVKL